MKKKRRVLLALAAMLLCLALALSALAEGPLNALYQAGTNLLFDTDNVSVTAHANFSYNGLQFKIADVTCRQDGVNSYLDVKLQTPRAYATAFESGFTVVGNGSVSYAIDPVDNPYVYNTSSIAESSSILSGSVLRRTMTRLGAAVVNAAEGSFADRITVSDGKDGPEYHVRVAKGQTPALVNAAGTLLWQLAAQRYFYIDYDYMGAVRSENAYSEVSVLYDDYSATFATEYQRMYGEALPGDFYDTLWDSDSPESKQAQERYSAVEDAIYEDIVQPLRQAYDHGVALVLPTGDADYYESYDAYIVAMGQQMVDFADFDAAFCAYYQKTTGSELPRDELEAIFYTDNEALIDAYMQMYEQMMEEYLAMAREDGRASLVYVNLDGSCRMIYDYEAYARGQSGWSTDTRQILNSMESLELGDCDFTVAMDGEGRIVSAQGTAVIIVIDDSGYENALEIAFDIAADHYGDTRVEEFDPKAYGVMTYAQFQEQSSALTAAREEKTFTLPETIVFDGVPYQLLLNDGEGAD